MAHDSLIGVNSRIKAGYYGKGCFDNKTDIFDVVYVLMEVCFVFWVVFVYERASFYGAFHVFLEMFDKDLFLLLFIVKYLIVEESGRVGNHSIFEFMLLLLFDFVYI